MPPPGVNHHEPASGRAGSQPWISSTDRSADQSGRARLRRSMTTEPTLANRRPVSWLSFRVTSTRRRHVPVSQATAFRQSGAAMPISPDRWCRRSSCTSISKGPSVRPSCWRSPLRNRVELPVDNVDELAGLYTFTDFDHFIELWMMTTHVIRTEVDFRQVVVSYAAGGGRARSRLHRGDLHAGRTHQRRRVVGRGVHRVLRRRGRGDGEARCRGAADARHPAQLRARRGAGDGALLDQVPRSWRGRPSGWAGRRLSIRPSRSSRAFRLAKDGGLGSVPHAGEVVGPESIRGAIDVLRADRHPSRRPRGRGSRPAPRARGAGDRVRRVPGVEPADADRTNRLATHPLPAMLEAGVLCSISTDDPAMFDTDLTRDYEAAAALGCSRKLAFRAGVRGALCDEQTRAELAALSEGFV